VTETRTSHRSASGAGPTACYLALSTALLAAAAGCQVAAQGQNAEGVRLFQQGQHHAALQRFQKAISSDGKSADAYYNMASVYHHLGKAQGNDGYTRQAEDLYNYCLSLDKNHAECHRGLAALLVETNRSDQAFGLLKGWVARSPQVADANIELARLYREFGDSKTEWIHLQEAIKKDHRNHRAWAALGNYHERTGDLAQAERNYQLALGLNSFQPAVSQRLAALQQQRAIRGGTPTPPGGTRTVVQPPSIPYR